MAKQFFCALAAAALLTPLWVQAQGQSVAPKAADPNEEAQIQFDQGKAFFNEGKFEEASIVLDRAYQLRPSYKILYYIGLAEAENGNFVRAVEAFQRYLSEVPKEEDPRRIEEVNRELKRGEAMIGLVVIDCAVEGAKVKVDNETKGITPLGGPIPINVGKHEITVHKDDKELLREVVRIAGGQKIELKVEASSQLAPIVAAAPFAQEQPAQGKRFWTWIFLGGAVAAGGAAAVTGSLALKKEKAVRRRCDDASYDYSDQTYCVHDDYEGDFDTDASQVKRLAIATDLLIGVAAAAAVTGIVLFVVEPRKGKEKSVAVSPALDSNGAGLFVTGRF